MSGTEGFVTLWLKVAVPRFTPCRPEINTSRLPHEIDFFVLAFFQNYHFFAGLASVWVVGVFCCA